MNKAVFIAWRGGGDASGHWSSVAQVEHAASEYRFVFTRGAESQQCDLATGLRSRSRMTTPSIRALITAQDLGAVAIRAVRVNTGAPLQMRLLCSLTAAWPANFEPCASEEFFPLAEEQVLAMAACGA